MVGLKMVIGSLLLCSLLLVGPGSAAAAGPREVTLLHYDLTVELAPDEQRLTARATITLPPDHPRRFVIALHRGLAPRSLTPQVILTPHEAAAHVERQARGPELFTVTLPPEAAAFTLTYQGKIDHPLGFAGQDYARGVQYTPGRISPEGVYLGPAAFWYPRLEEQSGLLSFRLQTLLPEGWTAVSQGRRLEAGLDESDQQTMDERMTREVSGPGESQVAALPAHLRQTVWEELNPQEGIFLVADRFSVYQDEAAGIATMAFLRQPDPELAARYLKATGHYLKKYSELLGPYPYAKFALVENAWESGFGMPSFTLLGSRVIRLPFILHSSYPHEILHNWWGNGVYTDYAAGNWNEGLTAYLADHLLMAEAGRGAEYRFGVLQKYADYAAGGRDFPLRAFTSRHSPAGEAVGYGKGLLFFHMLRRELGEEAFWAGVRHFYQANLFQVASFAHLRQSFELTGKRDLEPFFRQWLEREGAPQLGLAEVELKAEKGGNWRLKATFSQRQPGPLYQLQLPLAVTLAGAEEPQRRQVTLNERQLEWQETFPRRPLGLELDPDFELFRLLDPREIPPAFSRLYGSEEKMVVVLPAQEEELLPAYRELAAALGRFGSAGVEVVEDNRLGELPPARAVVLLGRHNRFRDRAEMMLPTLAAAILADGSLQIGTATYPAADHAFALALPHPADPAAVMGWIVLAQSTTTADLIRRLPHYHRYGALVFQGPEAGNILRHHWPAPASPLAVSFP